MGERRWRARSLSDRRWFWEDESGQISSDWVIVGLFVILVVFGLLGFWINDMYTNHTGVFANL